VFIVANTATIGLDALKKASAKRHLRSDQEVKQIPLLEPNEIGQ